MVRPNHDLSNVLVGGIRDYAAREDLDHEQAHEKLLRIALHDVEILGQNDATPDEIQ